MLVGLSVVILENPREGRNILVIPEEGVLLLTDLDGVTTELNRAMLAYISLYSYPRGKARGLCHIPEE